jgi:hypothetical protein
MSRGTMKNAVRGKSPVKYWLSWKGDTGQFQYWDSENQKNVIVEQAKMLVLDKRSTVTGWSEAFGGRIFANVVKNLKEDLVVRTKNHSIAKGPWTEIKEVVNKAGGNFCVNIYALAKLDESTEWEPVCLQVEKSCLSAWSDFLEENKIYEVYKGVVTVARGEEQQKGRVKYFVTKFVLNYLESLKNDDPDMDLEELEKQTKSFDIEYLQPYFNGEDYDEKAPF